MHTVAAFAERNTESRLALHRVESAESVPVCVLDERQSVRVAVAAVMECAGAETVAAAPPQQDNLLSAESWESRTISDSSRAGGARGGGDALSFVDC
jgi:hypothetical protein